MPVYFARAGENGPIKIGSARDVIMRLTSMQSGCPEDLILLRVTEGSRGAENWFHQQFSHLRIRREWFTFDPAMLSLEPPELLLAGDRRRIAGIDGRRERAA